MTKRHPTSGSTAKDADGLRRRLARARLQLLLGPADGDVLAIAEAAVRGGVDVVQLRWKGGPTNEVTRLAAALVREVGRDALVLVNDDLEAARAGGAHGAHVGEEDAPPEEARRRLGPSALLGLSTHDAPAAFAARRRGVDHVGFGAMFDTATKERPRVVGPGALAAVAELDVPCFAIGGIDRSNVEEVVAAGATRIAVSRAIARAADPEAAARALRDVLERATTPHRNP